MAALRVARGRASLAVVVVIGIVLSAATPVTEAAGVTSPPGYRIVIANYQAPQSTFTTLAAATCPTGTATWGGGLVWGAWSPPVSFNQSYWSGATPGAWKAAVSEPQAFTASFDVIAVCANKPSGYRLVTKTVDDPAGALATDVVRCPKTKVLLSGGVASTSDMTNVNIASVAPVSARGFRAYVQNSSALDQPFHLYALCAFKPPGYTRITTTTSLAPSDQVRIQSQCPATTRPIGGGIMLNPVTAGAIPEESSAEATGSAQSWQGMADNTTASAETMSVIAICAA
jgi:hypothetical protein